MIVYRERREKDREQGTYLVRQWRLLDLFTLYESWTLIATKIPTPDERSEP